MSDLRALFARYPEIAAELYYWGSEIVDGFDDFGSVIQSMEDGAYDETTAFGKLRIMCDSIIRLLEAGTETNSATRLPMPQDPWRTAGKAENPTTR